jgi:hypothetical protein
LFIKEFLFVLYAARPMSRAAFLTKTRAGFLAFICALAIAAGAGCGGNSDDSTISSSTAASATHPRGTTATLSGIQRADLSGRIVMPGFPYGDEFRMTAKGVGQAQGEREYVLWGRQGKTMILLGTWPAGPSGNLEVHDDLSIAKLLILVRQGSTEFLISRANTDQLWAAMADLGEYVKPSYIGTEVLEGPLTGPGIGAAQQ